MPFRCSWAKRAAMWPDDCRLPRLKDNGFIWADSPRRKARWLPEARPCPNHLRGAQREPISTLALTGRYRSGQTGQTVNLLALRLRWFESSPAQILCRSVRSNFNGLFAGHRRGGHHRTHHRRHSLLRHRHIRVRHHQVVAPLAGGPHSQSVVGLQRFGR